MTETKRGLVPAIVAATAGVLVLLAAIASPAADSSAPVSREEYETLRREMLQMKTELDALRRAGSPPAAASASGAAPAAVPAAKTAAAPQPAAESSSAIASLKAELEDVKEQVEQGRIGSTKFLLTGNASGGVVVPQHGSSNFEATFSPLLLWQLSDTLLVESEIEFELEDTDTETKLEYAQIAWSPLDFLTIGAGKFLTPMNVFVERYEPKWINKLPDNPLAVYDGILPESIVGFQARGGVPVGPTRLTYALYVGNGARLNTDDAESAGTLQFDNFTDLNDNKAVGGHVGFAPFSPYVEVGYGFEVGTASDPNDSVDNPDYVVQSVDLDASVDSERLLGRLGARGQYAWSEVDKRTYDPDSSLGYGPLRFSNKRDGGYVQASYRPTHAGIPYLADTELVFRYDAINNPGGIPDLVDEMRYTIGLDYWLMSSTVLKLAYEIDDQDGARDNDAFRLQAATGF